MYLKFLTISIMTLLWSGQINASMTIKLTGAFKKYDRSYVYLSKPDSLGLIKIPRSYLLNSPTNIPDKFIMSFELPIAEFFMHNRKAIAKTTNRKLIK